MKTFLILIAMVLLVGLVFASRGGELRLPETSEGPWFVVQVVKPRMARPLAGLLPESLFGTELRFDQTSPGAEVSRVEEHRLELKADGWELVIETDGEGHFVAGTRVVFPIELANKARVLDCRPADEAVGSFRTTRESNRAGVDGEFSIEVGACVSADTGKVIDWPSAPLTVRGKFVALSPDAD